MAEDEVETAAIAEELVACLEAAAAVGDCIDHGYTSLSCRAVR